MIYKFLLLVRSFLFNVLFMVWTMLIGSLWLPITFFSRSIEVIAKIGSIWAHVSLWLLRVICGIKVNVIGLHYVKLQPCIIASKHESAWETIFFLKLLANPVFIIKKELVQIPFYGWHLKSMGMISIDRSEGMASIKQVLLGTKNTFDNKRHLVIFPEGTRTAHGERNEIKSGIVAIHNKFPTIPIVPVFLDSGLYWNNKSWIKNPGTITLQFKPPIEKHLSKEKLIDQLLHDLNSPNIDNTL